MKVSDPDRVNWTIEADPNVVIRPLVCKPLKGRENTIRPIVR
jgi:hypothetical protein